MNDTNIAVSKAANLLAAAALIKTHPDLPAPYVTSFSSTDTVELNWYLRHREDTDELDDQRSAAQQIVKALGGTWDKFHESEDLRMRQRRGGLVFEILVKREAVCERVVVGTETVTIPATEAIPAQPAMPERTETRDVVEWRCAPLLAEPTEQAVA